HGRERHADNTSKDLFKRALDLSEASERFPRIVACWKCNTRSEEIVPVIQKIAVEPPAARLRRRAKGRFVEPPIIPLIQQMNNGVFVEHKSTLVRVCPGEPWAYRFHDLLQALNDAPHVRARTFG